MNAIKKWESLKRSKSMCSLTSENICNEVTFCKEHNFKSYRNENHTISDSSVDNCVIIDSDSEGEQKKNKVEDRSVFDGEDLQLLEQKIDRLSDMYLEQCRLLTTVKEDIRNCKAAVEKGEDAQIEFLADLVRKTVVSSDVQEDNATATDTSETNSRARSLLEAIEFRRGMSLDKEIRDALISFLQSDELRDQVVSATSESVKDVIGACISHDVSTLYLPLLEHYQRRLVRQLTKTVEDGFVELEVNSDCVSKSVFKITKSLQRSIEKHLRMLEAAADPQKNFMIILKNTVEEVLSSVLKQWQQKMLDVDPSQSQTDAYEDALDPPSPSIEYSPISPSQPANPDRSIIDQLMTTAEITKQMQDGEVNEAFERALSASDLSLVVAACRSAERAHVFQPRCRLRQHVLLALLQQLSTDMLHDTQLKCRYLEDAIINLDANNVITRSHLPLVVGEVRKHLTSFLSSYPSHVASRRIAVIIMAADNLLK